MSPHRAGILVFPDVTLLDVAGPADVLAEANRHGADYETVLVSPDGRAVRSSAGLIVSADVAAARAGSLGTLVVPGGAALAAAVPAPALVGCAALLAARAQRVGSVCTGAFLLAAAGILDGRRATTHERHAVTLQRHYPQVRVRPGAAVVADGPVMTSAGVTAGLDLALALVEADCGPALARDVARSLAMEPRQSPLPGPGGPPGPAGELLRQLLGAVAADPAGEHTVPALARAAGTSTRQLTRLFRSQLGSSPARQVRQIRLEHARRLLDAGYSVTVAARRSGFGSDENLRRAFRRHLGMAPAAYARRLPVPADRPGGRSQTGRLS